MIVSKEESIIVEFLEEPFDYSQVLDHSRFDPPAELSLPANAFEQEDE